MRFVIAVVLLALTPIGAPATVVTFDDLVGDNILVPDGYGGIIWHGEWTYYAFTQPPYTPASPPTRVYDFVSEGRMTFVTPDQIFDGAWFSGFAAATVEFRLYNDSILVWTSAILAPSDIPTFLASGYGGPVDEVGVFSPRPDFFIMDDVTYGGDVAVPEPSTAFLLAAGLLFLGGAGLRRFNKE